MEPLGTIIRSDPEPVSTVARSPIDSTVPV